MSDALTLSSTHDRHIRYHIILHISPLISRKIKTSFSDCEAVGRIVLDVRRSPRCVSVPKVGSSTDCRDQPQDARKIVAEVCVVMVASLPRELQTVR